MPRFTVPGRAAADATRTDSLVTKTSPGMVRITAVEYIPNSDVTGAATNSLTLELRNRGPDDAINVLVAQLALVAGTDAKRRFARAITLQQTANGAPIWLEGDRLEWVSVKVGSGLADPGGTVLVNAEAL
jgi:hypothetical protein